MESKIRIKMGPIEVEYEGSESFLKQELTGLLSALSSIYKESGIISSPDVDQDSSTMTGIRRKGTVQATTGTIAAKLGCKSGPDLIIAAAARLTLVLELESLPRQKILDEMKSATAYFKQSYTNNLSSYLGNLVKAGKLIESAKDTYALSAPTRTELEAKLADQSCS